MKNLDLRTRSSSLNALDSLSRRSQWISAELGNIGACQSRLKSAASLASVMKEDYEAAASRITDVDVASELAELTRQRIIQNISSSILAQANQQPALAIILLRY